MKYLLFLAFIFAVMCCSCHGAPSSSSSSENESNEWKKLTEAERQADDERVERIHKYYVNFTDFYQDSNPSVAAAIKKITTCIEENDLLEGLKEWTINMDRNQKSPLEVRKKICMKNEKFLNEFTECFKNDATPENKNLIAALSTFVKLHFKVFCKIDDITKFLLVADDWFVPRVLSPQERVPFNQSVFLLKNKIPPMEINYCLPVRVAEVYELAMIKDRKIPFKYRGDVAVAAHVGFTVVGKFPFKTLEECP